MDQKDKPIVSMSNEERENLWDDTHLKFHVEQRVRTHLRRRHKIKSRETAFTRFSSGSMYEKCKRYKVPTTAGWTKANALR